jgi:hypothetical protein
LLQLADDSAFEIETKKWLFVANMCRLETIQFVAK